jgi:Carbohydrate esterase, sialic acid-specific acetylesterase
MYPMLRRLTLGLALLLPCLSPAETRDLILVAGQSNAVGFDAYAEELPADPRDADTMFWWRVGDPPPDEFDGTSARQWTTLQFQPRTPAMPAIDGKKVARQYGNFNLKTKGGFGPEIGMIRTLTTKESRPVAVIKTAFSGTSVAGDWNVGLPGKADACYRAMIDEAKAALAAAKSKDLILRPRAFVWVQGESDANAKDSSVYAANLTKMLQSLRADLGAPDLILLLGVNTRFGNGKNAFMPKVVEAQKEVAATLPRARYVDTAGAETLPPSHTHFTAVGTLEIGRRYAEALLAAETALAK